MARRKNDEMMGCPTCGAFGHQRCKTASGKARKNPHSKRKMPTPSMESSPGKPEYRGTANWTSYPDYAYAQFYRNPRELMGPRGVASNASGAGSRFTARRNRSLVPVPDYIPQTQRGAAEDLYVYPKTKRYPIGDLFHARLALIYVMSPTNKSDRKKVKAAVKKAYPEYDWESYWEREFDRRHAIENGAKLNPACNPWENRSAVNARAQDLNMPDNAGPYLPEMFPYGQGGRPQAYVLKNPRKRRYPVRAYDLNLHSREVGPLFNGGLLASETDEVFVVGDDPTSEDYPYSAVIEYPPGRMGEFTFVVFFRSHTGKYKVGLWDDEAVNWNPWVTNVSTRMVAEKLAQALYAWGMGELEGSLKEASERIRWEVQAARPGRNIRKRRKRRKRRKKK